MRFLRFHGWGSTPIVPRVAAVALSLSSGCAGVETYSHGSGAYSHGSGAYNHGAGVLALDWGKCDQSDSTVTCCLKNHPGQYERCGATPPKQPQPINRPPPLLRPPESDEEKEEKEFVEKMCRKHYVRCIEAVGRKPGGSYGMTQCGDCLTYCNRHGFWPARVNKKKCAGTDP
jgi:hypothetical protein